MVSFNDSQMADELVECAQSLVDDVIIPFRIVRASSLPVYSPAPNTHSWNFYTSSSHGEMSLTSYSAPWY